MHTLSSYIVVFLGAGLGGVLRHTVNVAALRLGSDFAHSTLTVNVSGRLLWVCWRVGSLTKLIRVDLAAVLHNGHSWWLYDILIILVGDLAALYVFLSVALSLLGVLVGLAIIRAMN